jgi:hypothetical protein
MMTPTPTLAGLALAATLTLLPGAAQAWWACPSGMTMELRNNSSEVRCHTPTQYHDHDACPLATAAGVTVGTVIRRDFNGNHDKCVGYIAGNVVTQLDPTCNGGGLGYALERRSNPNPDRCRKPASEAAPNVKR